MAVTASLNRPGVDLDAARSDHMVAGWLFVVAFLVVCMVAVGGATRLTDSGLSITEWQPILGAIPPLSDADWQTAFDKYRQIPEYQRINKGMSLADFQYIYWWEWGHRFLGRLIGIAYAIPLALFWIAGRVPANRRLALVGVLALGGLQGFVHKGTPGNQRYIRPFTVNETRIQRVFFAVIFNFVFHQAVHALGLQKNHREQSHYEVKKLFFQEPLH